MSQDQNSIRKTIIIGSGPAGLTAAIYAARANLQPLVLAGSTPGGLLTKTSEVENFPGFQAGIPGPKLMEEMMEQAKRNGAELLWDEAMTLVWDRNIFQVRLASGPTLQGQTLIYAAGANPKRLGLKGELEYQPKQKPDAPVGGGSGVTYCAVCDGNFYRRQPVAVIGGGDSAMEEANYLGHICSEVTIVHRREGFRASQVMLQRAREKTNIRWALNKVVEEIVGDPKKKAVTALRLKDLRDGSVQTLPVQGVFIAIGHQPVTELVKDLCDRDEDGYLKVNDRQETRTPGLFAAGDCHDRRYRQAITAAGMGCKAALEAEKFLTLSGLL